jgi:Helix-turn-helix domain, rpiR family
MMISANVDEVSRSAVFPRPKTAFSGQRPEKVAFPRPCRVWSGEVNLEKVNGHSIGRRIRERLRDLTTLEARVFSAIVSHHSIDDQTLLKVVASEANVSQALVVKIAKKLGFDGFRSLQGGFPITTGL